MHAPLTSFRSRSKSFTFGARAARSLWIRFTLRSNTVGTAVANARRPEARNAGRIFESMISNTLRITVRAGGLWQDYSCTAGPADPPS